jgi:MFS family permease
MALIEDYMASLGVFGYYLVGMGLLFLVLTLCKPAEAKLQTSKPFKKFQYTFLVVYLLMFAGDWLQGPTVYALYSYYGFSRKQNGILFIAGFGCSMVVGTFAGSLADKYGRRLNCIMYGVIYCICCVTKHFNNYNVLMFGRLMGGIATSILWSAFESWMISEHHTRGFEESWVSSTFSLMTVGNGLVAIFSGLLAQAAVWGYGGHPVAPFDLSFALLTLGVVVIAATWTENYGDANAQMGTGMKDACNAIMKDKKVFLLGAIQSLFEGAMYTFVFMWTPILEQTGSIPHGVIFSIFMLSCSVGGSVFSYLVTRVKVEKFMRYVFFVSACTMVVPLVSTNAAVLMGAFAVYEVCVGIFWPGMGTMRSKYVPEEGRATIMNLFRVPLNALVCLILVYQGDLPVSYCFGFCAVFHGICTILQMVLLAVVDLDSSRNSGDEENLIVEAK